MAKYVQVPVAASDLEVTIVNAMPLIDILGDPDRRLIRMWPISTRVNKAENKEALGVWRQQPTQVTLLIFELVNWDRRKLSGSARHLLGVAIGRAMGVAPADLDGPSHATIASSTGGGLAYGATRDCTRCWPTGDVSPD